MSFWEDEEDTGDVPEFDPAESPLKTEDYESHLNMVLKRKFIEQYNKEHPGQISDTATLFLKYYTISFIWAEDYVERIIRHYYKSEIPYEDDLEPVDKNSFPSNNELKRFLKRIGYSIDWDAIDRYCNSQPTGENEKKQLKELQNYFKLLKKKVFEYYPQLEKLPSRGFRELERSLYTINYILWTDLQEAVERHLGINKEYYEEADRQLVQKRKEREERKKVIKNEGEDWLAEWEKMTDEEKEEREKLWEEREKLNQKAFDFGNKLVVEMSKTFVGFYPQLDAHYEDFLAKADKECWITYRDTYLIIHKIVEHFKTTDEPIEEGNESWYDDELQLFYIYKRMKEKNVPGAVETFLDCLDEDGKIVVYFEIHREGLGNTLLSNIYEAFPIILNFTSGAMKQIKNKIFGLARFNLKELYSVRDRILKVGTHYAEEWDQKMEEYQRKKFEGTGIGRLVLDIKHVSSTFQCLALFIGILEVQTW
ncbi:MAG: hypothetical protein HC831_21415 [Chloroflexia bacterium]|nr:hypothetical protein [Chloroflexia bacterium]